MTGLPQQQVPGLHHRRFGDVLVTAVSDGYLDANTGILRNIAPEDAESLLRVGGRPGLPRISVNCFLLRANGRIGLIETGSGKSMGPTMGWLPRSLAAAGVDRAEIDTVLLTHMHPDHSNGLTDVETGQPNFPNATLVVDDREVAHWHDDAAMARAPARQQERYFRQAREQFVPYRDRQRSTAGEVFPGITAVPIPGHTPGHTAYRLGSGNDALLVWGDTVHMPEVQVPHPEVTLEFDSDAEAAAASRRRVFDMAAREQLVVAGMHLHFPGFGRIVRQGSGYALLPEPWSFTL